MIVQREFFNIIYINRASSSHPSEGLNVLLSDLIKPLCEKNVDVIVHTTDRHEASLRRALVSNGVAESQVQIIRHRVGSMVLEFLSGRKAPSKKRGRLAVLKDGVVGLARRAAKAGASAATWFLDLTPRNFLFKVPLIVLFLLACLTGGLAAVPVLLVFAILIGSFVLFSHAVLRGFRRVRGRQFRGRLLLKRIAKRIFSARWRLVNELYTREQYRLAAAINRKKYIPFVFIPWAFDGALVSKLKARKIIVFPDAVTTLFPLRFPGEGLALTLNGIKQSLRYADGVICYSNFVRDIQLKRFSRLMRPETLVRVIPQGYFPLPAAPTPREVAIERLNKEKWRARNLFPGLTAAPIVPDFSQFQYIVYPTIDRPHKNTLVLVKALRLLIREKYKNVKLVLTTPALTSDVWSYISEKRLHRDVIVMPSVPVDVLDALCAGASVMVHPSLAEGGDIFNFSRAVSQGCPALLSDIPVVREMFDRADVVSRIYEPWLFEATNDVQLADKLSELLQDSSRTLAAQADILAQLGEYDFSEMAKCYHEFCKEIASGH